VSGARPAVLAVDGGNSKSDLALVADDGTLLASVRGPGITKPDLTRTLGLLTSLIDRAQRQAGRSGCPVARHLSACVANADLPEEEEALAAALRAQGWSDTTEVVNDTFAVLRTGLGAAAPAALSPAAEASPAAGPSSTADGSPAAGLPGPAGSSPATGPAPMDGGEAERHWGVAVTCGAGINCVGVAPDGRKTGFLALGETTGDWGGGHGLGQAALWWAMRAEDGRGPDTALRAAVAAQFGVPSAREVAIGIHLGTISEPALRELAPAVLALAGTGDDVAARLVRRQADEICTMALTAMRRLGLTGLATPVVLGGGVLAARDPMLIAGVTEGIRAGAPHAAVRITDVPPVAGAALLGLDRLGAGPEAERRLRANYAERTPP
jgi:N-acetylglucosamine kinase-like BadF-type ATPase